MPITIKWKVEDSQGRFTGKAALYSLMDITKRKWRAPQRALDPECLLEEYYEKLQKWGLVLTRGDRAMADEIVHDLCLYFAVAKPDLSQVANLDGYLYTCLRHIYLSALGRSSREALQTVSVADFDSIHFALRTHTFDSLVEQQNELRRICNYTVWRKDSSKSASYFILHFFHGYARSEIAAIACLPIAAIYNKLKVAREEVKSHLEATGKLHFATRGTPPEIELLLSPIPSSELFDALERMIFKSRSSDCLSEEALLQHYQSATPTPIPCGLLSHIVSCKRCLTLINREFQRPSGEDREPPGGVWSSIDQRDAIPIAHDSKSYLALMQAIRWQKGRVCDHRPKTLSIAVNGKIAASHDVHGQCSTLAARVDLPQAAQFVEVFTDQRIRLAMLPVAEFCPEGPCSQRQRISLTDDRWLELALSFDGLGLHSEVTYFDPTLAVRMFEEEVEEELSAIESAQETLFPRSAETPSEIHAVSIFTRFARSFRTKPLRFTLAWTMMIAVALVGTSYVIYRHNGRPSENAYETLNRSIQIEATELEGETLHQTLRLDAVGAAGNVLWQGTVDVWKENDTGRTMRRLYDSQHRLIAAAWRGVDGQSGSSLEANHGDLSDSDREIVASALWQQDISARAFHELAPGPMQIGIAGMNYELAGSGISDGPAHVVSATLVLDPGLHVVGETLRVRDDSQIKEARFVETGYERHPSASVPATVFEPPDLDTHWNGDRGSTFPGRPDAPALLGSNTRLVQLQIAVLFELNKLGADTGEPIEVSRTSAGHIRVSGAVADESREREISAALEALPDHELIDIRLAAQSDLRTLSLRWAPQPVTSVYSVAQTVAPADALLQKYFAGRGWNAEQAKSAARQFADDVLGHSRLALQHAYALDRLGTAFSADELRRAGHVSEREWAEMAMRHATALETELRDLREQLIEIAPQDDQSSAADRDSLSLDTPGRFAQAANELLGQMQNLNRSVGKVFTAGSQEKDAQSADSLIAETIRSIPTHQAARMAAFATRIANSDSAAASPENDAGEESPRRSH